jgi:hypothetical protein
VLLPAAAPAGEVGSESGEQHKPKDALLPLVNGGGPGGLSALAPPGVGPEDVRFISFVVALWVVVVCLMAVLATKATPDPIPALRNLLSST